ncbi:MAG: UDP-N-acetylmuramate dehydrogenase [Lactobacillus sp.]
MILSAEQEKECGQVLKINDPKIKIQKNVPLSRFSFTKTGGPAEMLVFPENVEQVRTLVNACREQKVPLTVIGNASNLIIRDGGIKGLTMILTKLNKIEVKDNVVTAQAGARIIDTSFAAGRAGLSGLEFAAGIPGSVGGAVFMNAGAYGGETKDCFEQATVLTRAGQLKTYNHEQMNFSYRHSVVQETGDIVLQASFKLKQGVRTVILDQMNYLNALRRYKQPLDYPSCGSVFKRPKGHFVGPMIIAAGLQGSHVGGAQNSNKHAGFIINTGGATATDYLGEIHKIQKGVKAKFHLDLHTEVRIIGEEA